MPDKIDTQSTAAVADSGYLKKLKAKWELDSSLQVILVLIVFALTGSSVVYLRKGLFFMLGFDDNTAFWLKTVTYILFIFPTYQVLLLFYGFLLGQFHFFWNKEKKMARAIKNLFVKTR